MVDSLFGGMKIVTQPPVKTKVQVKRTWKERLLSLSWFTKYKTEERICDVLKRGQVVRSGDTLVMSYQTYHDISEKLKAEKANHENRND